MTKKLLKKYYPLLEALSKVESDVRVTILGFLDEQAYKALHECVRNCVTNPTFSNTTKEKVISELQDKKDLYRDILNLKGGNNKLKKNIIQIGGSGLGLILETTLPPLSKYLE